jgi:hypothetical protein
MSDDFTPEVEAVEVDTPEIDTSVVEDPPVFSAEYVAGVRNEAARYRTEANRYKQAFEGYDDETVDTWLTAVATWKEDPATVAEWMVEQGSPYLDKNNEEAFNEAEMPLTRYELQEILAERDNESATEMAVQSVMSEASELGYEPGSSEYIQLLYIANNETEGDLVAAAEVLDQQYTKMIEAYIAEKSGNMAPPPTGGIAANQDGVIDWKEARAAAEQRIQNIL